MMDIIKYAIDINDNIENVVTVKQQDHNSRYMCLTISDRQDESDPQSESFPMNLTGCRARMYVELGDDYCTYFDGEVEDGDNGVVSFLLPNSVTQTVGDYRAEIWLTDPISGSLISTRMFTIRVLESLRKDTAIEATDQFTALDDALNKMDKATEICEGATVNANTAAETANAAAESATAAMQAIINGVDGIVITDTADDTRYLAKFRLVGGKPAIEYTDIDTIISADISADIKQSS